MTRLNHSSISNVKNINELYYRINMPRNPVIFLDKTYKTQGEFEAFVKNLIYNEIGICDDIEVIHPLHYVN